MQPARATTIPDTARKAPGRSGRPRRHAARGRLSSLAWGLLMAAAALAWAAPPVAAGEPAAGIAGHWEGAIELPGAALAFDVDVAATEGGWVADISIPAQGAKDLPLANVTFDGDKVGFDLPGVPGDPKFRGSLEAGGASIAGTFTQGGGSFPFKMKRGGDAGKAAAAALEGFDAIVEGALADFKVPGVGIAILKGDEVVLMKGYGLRDVEKGLPVTPRSLFAIGSSTKAFTTFVMGTLVDEGKLDWDRPVASYLPGFRLYDRSAGERITPRDLVTHRSGLPRHDLVWYNGTLSRREMVERLAYLEPYRDLRQEFHYQNLMFLTAGYLVEQITGASWEDAVRDRIFRPLGMSRSNFSVKDSQASDDFALPYEEKDDVVRRMPFRDITNVGPAGSINSSVEEMAAWVKAQLGRTAAGVSPPISGPMLAEMHKTQMAIAVTPEHPEMPTVAYGLGWFVEPYRGRFRVHHGGNIDGFSAMVSVLPQDDLGLVILANKNGTGVPELLMRTAIDRLLGLPPIDWLAEAKARRDKELAARKEAAAKKDSVRRAGTKPGHDLAEYAGEYEHPGYGVMKVELREGRLVAVFTGIETPLDHWHYEVFNGAKGSKDPVFEDMKFLFRTGLKGRVDAIEIPFEPEVANIVFKRKAEARMFDPAWLSRFTGTYDLSGQAIKVVLQGKALVAHVPGQPSYELVPEQGTEFALKAYSIIHVIFAMDAAGKVTAVDFDQPEGLFTAKKIE